MLSHLPAQIVGGTISQQRANNRRFRRNQQPQPQSNHEKKTTMNTNLKGLCLALLLGLSAAWGQNTPEIRIITTTTDLADITRQITGSLASVESLCSGQQDPHTLTARPSFIIKAREADVWIRIGMELEVGWEQPILRDSRNRRIQPGAPGHIDASVNVIRQDVPKVKVSRAEGDIHPYGNPHYWLDPLNGRIIAATIAERLTALYPRHAEAFQNNLAAFQRDLDGRMFGTALVSRIDGAALWKQLVDGRLDGFLQTQGLTAELGGWYAQLRPFAGRRVATYHRSWNYLLERFGIILAAELEPKPGIPPSARHLASLEKDFKEHDIRLILQEPFYSRKAADRLASRTGAAVLVCANSTHGSNEAESYLAMLDTVIAGLAQHLRP